MLELEKRLANADLNQFKEIPEKTFAKGCLEYQNFATKEALKHINTYGLSKIAARCYFGQANTYIKTGKCNFRGLPVTIRKYLDEYIQSGKFDVITPNWKEKRKQMPRRRKSTKKTIMDYCEKVEVPVKRKLVEEFLYGCLVDDCIYTFKTEKELNAFIKGVSLSNKEYKVKHISKEWLERIDV